MVRVFDEFADDERRKDSRRFNPGARAEDMRFRAIVQFLICDSTSSSDSLNSYLHSALTGKYSNR
jgi:hypothetical protein